MVGGGVVSRPSETLADMVADAQRCAIVAVTLPEEMPVNETLEMGRKIERDVGARLQAVVMNQVVPPLIADDDPAATVFGMLRDAVSEEPNSLGHAVALGVIRSDASARAGGYMTRLGDELGLEVVPVPLHTSLEPGPDLTAAIASQLAQFASVPAQAAS